VDDSAGEAFDKVAKMLEVGYPGGPNVEKWATKGNPKAFHLPIPMKGKPGCDFSFSGLKTAVRTYIEKGPLSAQDKYDMCAAFQNAVLEEMLDRLKHAIQVFKERYPDGQSLVMSGGVAANRALRTGIEALAKKHGLIFCAPDPALCTDNGVMVAWAGMEYLQHQKFSSLDFKARPRWPLDKRI